MRILLAYTTDAGIFYIGQSDDRRYHPIYNDESLGSYKTVQNAVDDLVNNAIESILHLETKELIDTSKLGIPQDYTQWDTLY